MERGRGRVIADIGRDRPGAHRPIQPLEIGAGADEAARRELRRVAPVRLVAEPDDDTGIDQFITVIFIIEDDGETFNKIVEFLDNLKVI